LHGVAGKLYFYQRLTHILRSAFKMTNQLTNTFHVLTKQFRPWKNSHEKRLLGTQTIREKNTTEIDLRQAGILSMTGYELDDHTPQS
jgi:hypothetical protein